MSLFHFDILSMLLFFTLLDTGICTAVPLISLLLTDGSTLRLVSLQRYPFSRVTELVLRCNHLIKGFVVVRLFITHFAHNPWCSSLEESFLNITKKSDNKAVKNQARFYTLSVEIEFLYRLNCSIHDAIILTLFNKSSTLQFDEDSKGSFQSSVNKAEWESEENQGSLIHFYQ